MFQSVSKPRRLLDTVALWARNYTFTLLLKEPSCTEHIVFALSMEDELAKSAIALGKLKKS